MNVFKLNPNKIILAVLICAVVMLSGLSYAFYKLSLVGSEEITLISGSLELSFSDSSGKIIKLDNAEPISDEEGLSIEAYQFSLRNVGDLDSSYTLYLDDSLGLDQQKMNDKYIKYVLEKNGEVGDIKYLSDNPYTGCSFVNGNFQCTNNIYTLPSRVAKARLITLQEAMYAGCANSRYSCPKWMWANGEMITMSAISDSRVYSISDIFMDVSIDSTHDVRAVVDIFK